MNKFYLIFLLFSFNLSIFGANDKTLGVFTVTAYCSCEKCCGKWAKYNKTASGNTPKQGVTVAGPRNIPLGTQIFIENVGIRTVQDRLAKKYDSRIDVYFSNHQEALKFGIKKLQVKLVQNKSPPK